jgi:hypothetical protein
MQKQLKKLGLINSSKFISNAIVRIPVRLLPEKTLTKVYTRFARKDIAGL